MPSLDGYPSRAIRTDRWLYIMNPEPGRWPHGVPRTPPTPSAAIEFRRFHELCFAKRPAEELYDVQADPDQVDGWLAMLCGFMLEARDRPVPPTSPYLRVHARWWSEAAWSWLADRRGWH